MCGAVAAAAIVVSGIAPPVFAEIHGGAPPIPSLVQAGATQVTWIPSGRVLLAQTKNGVDRNVIKEIQRLLAQRGLDPGPADGSMGPKTSRAIARYQKSAGLAADGRPTRELLDHLRKPPGDAGGGADETNEAAPVVGVETSEDPPPPPPPLPPVPSLTNTVWRFTDETGSTFTLTFAPNGVVKGVLYERFWNWRQSGDNVTIAYDNGMGLQVTRSGTLSGPDAMSGSASASHSGEWTWTAEKVPEAG